MIRGYFAQLILLVPMMVFAQPTVRWSSIFGDYQNLTEGHDAIAMPDGGFMVLGTSDGAFNQIPKTLLFRINAEGDTLWTRSYGDGVSEFSMRSISRTTDGGYIMVGNIQIYHGADGLTLFKVDANGDSLWTRMYYPNQSMGFSIVALTDGGFAISGFWQSDGLPYNALLAMRTDSIGNLRWSTFVDQGVLSGSSGQQIVRTLDGGFMVAGYCDLPSPRNFLCVRLNAEGDTLWTRIVDLELSERDVSLCLGEDGSVVMVSSSGAAAKLSANGDLEWARYYPFGSIIRFFDICSIPGGGVIICGVFRRTLDDPTMTFLMRLTDSGDTVWTATYYYAPSSGMLTILPLSDGGYFTAGEIFDLGGFTARMLLLRFDAELPAQSRPDLAHEFSLSAYPNPFNATTTISFTLPKTESVELNVYDVTGRLVRVLIGRTLGSPLQAGTHDIAFDGGDLPSGIYFVRMEAGGIWQTQKTVLLR